MCLLAALHQASENVVLVANDPRQTVGLREIDVDAVVYPLRDTKHDLGYDIDRPERGDDRFQNRDPRGYIEIL